MRRSLSSHESVWYAPSPWDSATAAKLGVFAVLIIQLIFLSTCHENESYFVNVFRRYISGLRVDKLVSEKNVIQRMDRLGGEGCYLQRGVSLGRSRPDLVVGGTRAFPGGDARGFGWPRARGSVSVLPNRAWANEATPNQTFLQPQVPRRRSGLAACLRPPIWERPLVSRLFPQRSPDLIAPFLYAASHR